MNIPFIYLLLVFILSGAIECRFPKEFDHDSNDMDEYEKVNELFRPKAQFFSSRLIMKILTAIQLKASVGDLTVGDIVLLARLIVLINKKKAFIEEARPVYWYSRQG